LSFGHFVEELGEVANTSVDERAGSQARSPAEKRSTMVSLLDLKRSASTRGAANVRSEIRLDRGDRQHERLPDVMAIRRAGDELAGFERP
jgi:hypothetical protein